jgi:hypothetical protein
MFIIYLVVAWYIFLTLSLDMSENKETDFLNKKNITKFATLGAIIAIIKIFNIM